VCNFSDKSFSYHYIVAIINIIMKRGITVNRQFRTKLIYLVLIGLCLHGGTVLCLEASTKAAKAERALDYVDLVDPYIMSARGRWFFFGTGKRPFGMVNVFPDTKNDGQAQGGYNYSYTDVIKFCHLHGWMTVGLDVMPTTGGNYGLNKDGWKSSFSRDTEVVRPGYHKVTLDKYAMDVEITSTERVGYHRYHYRKSGAGGYHCESGWEEWLYGNGEWPRGGGEC
jgi:putative alpha-1,2-mannosidase